MRWHLGPWGQVWQQTDGPECDGRAQALDSFIQQSCTFLCNWSYYYFESVTCSQIYVLNWAVQFMGTGKDRQTHRPHSSAMFPDIAYCSGKKLTCGPPLSLTPAPLSNWSCLQARTKGVIHWELKFPPSCWEERRCKSTRSYLELLKSRPYWCGKNHMWVSPGI